ncbi:ExbD/TolR family protein [Colwellia psychrerythraea]|uniref:Biopolymer transport protein ExbD/TolR n=1 Tax=Colwellia psychrerythraea TaxID=28229 RepID=A0A099KW48_COLPS|nr:biopolymer transporter ExbD [Colwellia psychrerythraea]KGJ94801.1 Biopolymer transport protein ExbD/TolR [Colwellia psychrerythraea]
MSKAKLSGRSKRMSSFEGLHKHGGLNLVSLMDIFTILVFFLLVSSGSQQLPSSKDITLPTSVADKVPKETLIISITSTDVLVQGKKVADVAELLTTDEIIINALVTELNFRADNRLYAKTQQSEGLAITIMGDENIPYQLLRKILATCRQTNYTKIAFAAVQTAKNKG